MRLAGEPIGLFFGFAFLPSIVALRQMKISVPAHTPHGKRRRREPWIHLGARLFRDGQARTSDWNELRSVRSVDIFVEVSRLGANVRLSRARVRGTAAALAPPRIRGSGSKCIQPPW
jgi:hypothetical protein